MQDLNRLPLSLPRKTQCFSVILSATQSWDNVHLMLQCAASLEISLKGALGLGKGRDRALTCDLTKNYVAINGDYRS